jgi:hypothetical protein
MTSVLKKHQFKTQAFSKTTWQIFYNLMKLQIKKNFPIFSLQVEKYWQYQKQVFQNKTEILVSAFGNFNLKGLKYMHG